AITTLARVPGFRRRLLIAGVMLELGPTSPQLHREAGAQAASFGTVDWIFAVQGDAREVLRGAASAGHSPAHERFFSTAQEAAEFLPGFLEAGDLVLLKGSRGVHLEQLAKAFGERSPLVGAAASTREDMH